MSDAAVWMALVVVHGMAWLVLLGSAFVHYRHRRSV